MKTKNTKIIISGGGTGGHIYPAIAIANEIKKQLPSAQILFVGAEGKMEMQLVPKAGYDIKGLWISGIQRKLTLKNVMFPIKLASSLWKARRIITKFKPQIVIGTGGYASGAVLKVAQMMNIPTLIQEQNSYPGITNKWLAAKAKAVCVAYDTVEKFLPKSNLILTGNPVREDLGNVDGLKEEAMAFFNLDYRKKTLVVLGGSLGAKKINECIERNIDFFQENDLQLLWQCGKIYYDKYKHYNSSHYGIKVLDFVHEMRYLYSVADIIVSRAGASTVSELCIVGKPVIFVPSPNVAEDHQTKNAVSIEEQGAAVVINEKDLEQLFQLEVQKINKDEDFANKLATNIKKIAKVNATKAIVEEVKKYI